MSRRTKRGAHTPGPWHVVDTLACEDDDIAPSIEIMAGKQFVASLNDIHDANLIACAPDLLAALRECASTIQHLDPNATVIGRARAAIARATEGSEK